ncbi:MULTISPECIES: hypothetical protein [unclassified Sulfitobacter]|jgi:hypothetical protein|uniref:hypothetical protein n=1 Tax=unclassified Sulfitobacter TaxID=196795 RepID=UPI0015945F0A|nr:hypothetical protein [Sulfitobacter sp. HGT1]
MNRLLFIGFCLVVAFAIGVGLWVVGGPEYARMVDQDRQRVFDLDVLADQIACVGQPKRVLPDNLEELEPCFGRPDANRNDPVTNMPFRYTVLGPDAFELCAELAIDPKAARRTLPYKNDLILRSGNTVCLVRRKAVAD